MSERRSHQETMHALLRQMKDRRYRRGIIQMAASFDIITHGEWVYLDRQIREFEPEPRIDAKHNLTSTRESSQ